MNYKIAEPKPGSLVESLRSVGYTLPAAVADIVDNSIAAEAQNVWIRFHWAGTDSYILIADDGHGMSEGELHEAMRPGSRSPSEERAPGDLGRFGLGLKTASFSQCRVLTVISRRKDTKLAARTWDLDYVVRHNEWRLLTTTKSATASTDALDGQESGTVVFWQNLDRLTQGENTGDAAAHCRFNDSIDIVTQHLALTFHRFIEDGSVTIHMNGNPVKAWNPFLEGHPATYRTPEEVIPFGDSSVTFRGYVLPHKDMLGEEGFVAAAGPAGWTAHQGFYVYRNKRLLVPGDWLRLGRPYPWTRSDQFNLARIRLDLPNDMDSEWHLDVKKSTARPPALLRDRLTELAENIRTRARSVFVHRGRFGTKIAPVEKFERPWQPVMQNGLRVYRINRSHPAVQTILKANERHADELESLLRVLEETVPVQQIWLDVAEQTKEPARPYAAIEFPVIRADIRRAFDCLVKGGINKATARARLLMIEPYNLYPDLINDL